MWQSFTEVFSPPTLFPMYEYTPFERYRLSFGFLNPEARLSGNVGKKLQLLTQSSADLSYFAAEAKNHA
jgi:hypothetical protein